jgi:hypothetical protein
MESRVRIVRGGQVVWCHSRMRVTYHGVGRGLSMAPLHDILGEDG